MTGISLFLRHTDRYPARLMNCEQHGQVYQMSSASAGLSIEASRDVQPASILSDDETIVLSLPIPLKVTAMVHEDIRRFLDLKNSERKTKLILPKKYTAAQLTNAFLRQGIEKQIPRLSETPYVLRYEIADKMYSTLHKRIDNYALPELLSRVAAEGKALHLLVEPNLSVNFPPVPVDKPYLHNMPDPADTDSYSMVSFYKFYNFQDPQTTVEALEEVWKPFRVFGRVYVAAEGLNAQMTIPTNVLEHFRKATMENFDCFKSDLFLNVDHTLTPQEFENTKPFKALHIRVREQIVADGFVSGSFEESEIGQRLQSDAQQGAAIESAEKSVQFNWHKSGREMSPLEWHEQLDNPEAIILDCRNSYETDVGIFENAEPLKTTFFRESWDALDERLVGVPKDAPIMTYCTGGIRCVKINAYLEQKLGFTNSSRLAGGIINYTRELEKLKKEQQQLQSLGAEQAEKGFAKANVTNVTTDSSAPVHLARHVPESKFKGTNYVFDERMGARITADLLTGCETCGEPSDLFTNCNYDRCHVRYIQCYQCRQKYSGCCSKYCQGKHHEQLELDAKDDQRVTAIRQRKQDLISSQSQLMSRKAMAKAAVADRKVNNAVETAATSKSASAEISSLNMTAATPLQIMNDTKDVRLGHAANADAFLEAINNYCEKYSSAEDEVLRELREDTESTMKPSVARMISGPLQGTLLTTLARIIRAQSALELGTFTGYATIAMARGMETYVDSKMTPMVHTCEIDSVSADIAETYFKKAKLSDQISLERVPAAEMIARARTAGLSFDLVFIDADKKKYSDYLMDLVGKSVGEGKEEEVVDGYSRCLLRPNALVIVDNTLWKGLVLSHDEVTSDKAPNPELYGSGRRMQALAQTMHTFNDFVRNQSQLFDVVMLPLRDGLTILRYRGVDVPKQ